MSLTETQQPAFTPVCRRLNFAFFCLLFAFFCLRFALIRSKFVSISLHSNLLMRIFVKAKQPNMLLTLCKSARTPPFHPHFICFGVVLLMVGAGFVSINPLYHEHNC